MEQDTPMKKKHALLSLIGATLITSCVNNIGSEISDKTEIQELEKAISARMKEVKNYEAVSKSLISYKYASRDDEKHEAEVVYRVDENSNKFVSVSYKANGAKTSYSGYEVTDKDYGRVIYYENYDPKYGTYGQALLPDEYKSIESGIYDEPTLWSYAPFIALLNIEVFFEASDPLFLSAYDDQIYSPGTIKYYSKGEGSLTIDLKTGETDGNRVSSSATLLTYENYLLKSATFESKSISDSETREEKYEVSFKTFNSLSITLPNGWEKTLQRN